MTLCICKSKKSVSFAQKSSNRFMRGRRVRSEVVMSFAFEHDELGVGDCSCKIVSGVVVRSIGGAVALVVAYQHEGRHTNLLQTFRMVVTLTRKHEIEIVLQGRDARHAHAQKVFDQLGMRRNEFLGPAGFDRVLANVIFKSQTHHVAAHRERNTVSAGVRTAARSADQFLDLARMIESEQLRNDTAHGMTADNRWLGIQMIEQSRGVVREHFDRVFLYGPARFARATVIEDDHAVIAREFGDLVKFPGLMIETSDTAQQKRRDRKSVV